METVLGRIVGDTMEPLFPSVLRELGQEIQRRQPIILGMSTRGVVRLPLD